ncbi:HEAT repeat domain-containing protein [Altericista sp. CCNU0014]|uniref:HEAT repeat domain-containing protein n=1 Tax=Altericista sp. CCNU0014 TaxID=3082949 RepID=UPI00384FE7B2
MTYALLATGMELSWEFNHLLSHEATSLENGANLERQTNRVPSRAGDGCIAMGASRSIGIAIIFLWGIAVPVVALLQRSKEPDPQSTSARQQEEIIALIDQLNSSDTEVSLYASKRLNEIGQFSKVGLPKLVLLLKDPNPDVRSSAVDALGYMRKSSQLIIPQLIPLLQDRDGWVRGRTAAALGEFGEPAKVAIPRLIRLLNDYDPIVRSFAAATLGKVGRSARVTIPYLIPLLKDPDPFVRENAAKTLTILGYKMPPPSQNKK